jgi:NTP pyrophosphatase (non-canonical NTP hydrolase)
VTLDEYQAQARSTAVYSSQHARVYPALGLAGEAGEMLNKYKKVLRGDTDIAAASPSLVDELGDCLWYAANVAADCGFKLSSCLGCQELSEVEPRSPEAMSCAMLVLADAVGQVCSCIADDQPAIAVSDALQDALLQLASVADGLAVTLEQVAVRNLAKLQDRQQRGQLRGEGDQR